MTTRNSVYEGVELEQYEEATRLIPAIAKLRHEGRYDDVKKLLVDYTTEGCEKNLSLATSWSILWAATQRWVDQLFVLQAERDGATVDEAIDKGIAWATTWMVEGD